MTPTKPDRRERSIEKLQTTDEWNVRTITSTAALTLLRKEHAAVVRMVKNVLNESIVRDLPETGPGYQCACRHILDQLKRREK